MMVPDPSFSAETHKEKINSATRLPAATLAFKILNNLEMVPHRENARKYQVKPKQLSLCLTGRKYLGGTNRKAITENVRLQEKNHLPAHQKKTKYQHSTELLSHSPVADNKSAR